MGFVSYRKERVESLLRDLLNELFKFHIKNEKLKNIYITHIILTNDLKLAKVYYRVNRFDNEVELDIKVIESNLLKSKGYIRRFIAKQAYLKYIPDLKFFFDDSLETFDRIEKLLEKLRHGE